MRAVGPTKAVDPGAPRLLAAARALVAIESLIDDARRENLQGLLMSLNMLIEFGDAFDYFKRFEVIHLAGPSSAAVACK